MTPNIKKVVLLLLILFVGISVVSASDDFDDNTLEQTYESPQVEESNYYNNLENTNINENLNDDEDTTPVTVTNANYDTVMGSLSNYDTITFDDTFTGKTMNINAPVTITATSTAQFTDSQISITVSGVTISNLNIENTDIDGSVITATNVNNIILDSNNIVTNNANNYEKAIGITFNNVNNSYIQNSNIIVSGYPQTMGWDNTTGVWLSESQVTAIYMSQVNYINVTNNYVSVNNSSLPVNDYTTVEGITLKTNSNYVNITNNEIYINGSNYVYAISLSNVVTHANISNNGILMISNNYLNGIQLDKTNHSYVHNNTILGYSIIESEYVPSYERVAYGIVVTTSNYMATSAESVNNTISSNSIILESAIIYAVELYMADETTIEYNEITCEGNVTIGIGLYNSSDNTISGNTITLDAHNKTIDTSFYEQITPTSCGIIIVGNENSSNNNVYNNQILVEDDEYRDDNLFSIIVRASGNSITNNNLLSGDMNDILGGDDSVSADNGNTVSGNYC